ncbi:DUF362 domain-containing protein [uncultured Victivallis sp.]|uniref:DUF362 domain-containing protein n=1 Tax=uncultured Victivallis sp. TaxID=354118 RepID=UPI0025D0350E|nr:DUF362 domain-containing protein [uncultured Victivallis sp.]
MSVQVSVRRVASYDTDLTVELRKLLAPLGGMRAFVNPGEKVLLKPNLLGPFAPESAVTTHPAVVEAAARLVLEAGGRCFVGDSSGCGSRDSVLRATGIGEVIRRLRLEWADLDTPADYEFANVRVARKIRLGAPLAQMNKIINLPKAKTHVQMVATGAMKNLYGYLPGTSKSEYHYRLKTREWLAELQLDLAVALPPVLNIMDAITAMEGEGPSGGTPRQLGFLAASVETVALDVVTFRAMNLDPEQIPLLAAAKRRPFGTTDPDAIELIGATPEELRCPDFRPIRQLGSPLRLLPLPQSMLDFVQRRWKAVPHIDTEKCIRCMRCRDGCPVRPPAIDPERAAVADPALCIKCYCCHEFCPVKAISVNPTFLERFLLTPRLRTLAARLAGKIKA